MKIPEHLRSELEQLFLADSGRLGDVFRLDREGKQNEEIRKALDISSTSTIGHSRRSVESIRDGRNLPGIGPAQRAHRDLKRIMREQHGRLSPELRVALDERLEELRIHVQELEERGLVEAEFEGGNDVVQTSEAIAGVYVWSVSTYLRDEDDRQNVWLRIGQSDDVLRRFGDHKREVKLPEPLRLLRVYSHHQVDPPQLEKDFHAMCSVARHHRALVNNREREWFRSSLEFLDELAAQRGCLFHDELTDPDFRRD